MDSKNLVVKFNEIPQGGLHFDLKSGDLDAVLSDLVQKGTTYEVGLHLQKLEKTTHLRGQIQATLKPACSRCAEEFDFPVSKKFTILYYKSEEEAKTLTEGLETLEDLNASFDLDFISSQELDLKEVVHEQLALEIPFQPLCKEDCKGLCATCGENLNLVPPQVHQLQHLGELSLNNPAFSKLKEWQGE